MSDQNAAAAKKASKVKSPTQKELKRPQDNIRQQNKVKRTNKRGRNNTSGDISTETRLFTMPSMSCNPGKAVACTEVPRDENILTMQSEEGQYHKKKIDNVHSNIHLDHHDMSGSSAPILTATEGSLSHPMDDESKQMHANSLDVKVSNSQFLKDSLPIIEHAGSSGEGLPYAPENWPSPGDVWTWHVGKRCTRAGFWQDRSVHPPDSLRSSTGNKMTFNSRVSLEQYIRNTFPDANVDAFFASFIWKIPCTNAAKEIANASPKIIKSNECSKAEASVRPGDCKANNEMCSIKAKTSSSLTPSTCYICCTEPKFCRYCCCILCSKTIDWIYEGYNFIKCEAPVDEKFICGHVAHIECALRAYMAEKVGGSIDLETQYYCRCCDNKTDLLLHVDKIIKVCESIDSRDDKGKVLNLALCILRGSKKEKAKKLQNHIAMLMEKLKLGASPDEICKMKSEISEPVQGPTLGHESEIQHEFPPPDINAYLKGEEHPSLQQDQKANPAWFDSQKDKGATMPGQSEEKRQEHRSSHHSSSSQGSDKGKRGSLLAGMMKYAKGDVRQGQESFDSASRPYISRSRESSPQKSSRRRRRSRSRSPPRDRSGGRKRSRHHQKDHNSTQQKSYSRGHDSSCHEESKRTLSEHPASTHMGSYSIPSTLADGSQSTMSPLSSSTPLSSAATLVECPPSPQHGFIPLEPLAPIDLASLDAAVEYATYTRDWIMTASYNLGLLSSKYDLAKHRIANDHKRIDELSTSLQTSEDNLKRVSEESTKLSNSLSQQCNIVTEVEKNLEKVEVEKAAMTKELMEAGDALNRQIEAALKTVEENKKLRADLQTSEEQKKMQDTSILLLETEKTRLLDENISLGEELDQHKEVIDSTSRVLEAMIYKSWKHKGITWSDEYDEWMLMIKKESIKEARTDAKAEGREFDEQLFLISTFSEEELWALARAEAAEEAKQSINWTTSEFSSGGEEETGSKATEASKDQRTSGSSLSKVPKDPMGPTSSSTTPFLHIPAESIVSHIISDATEPSLHTVVVSSITSVTDLTTTETTTTMPSDARMIDAIVDLDSLQQSFPKAGCSFPTRRALYR